MGRRDLPWPGLGLPYLASPGLGSGAHPHRPHPCPIVQMGKLRPGVGAAQGQAAGVVKSSHSEAEWAMGPDLPSAKALMPAHPAQVP